MKNTMFAQSAHGGPGGGRGGGGGGAQLALTQPVVISGPWRTPGRVLSMRKQLAVLLLKTNV